MKADQGSPETMRLSKTGGRYLLTGEGCSVQTGHNDFEYEQDRNPKYFLLVRGLEVTTIWVRHGWHWPVDYLMK